MQTVLDQAITTAAAAEATYVADLANVDNIKLAIASAQAPLSGAEDQANTDGQVAKAAYLALAVAATEAANSIPDVVASVV